MIREVGRDDHGRIREVLDWPLREVMLAYVALLKAAALRTYEMELLVWSSLAPHMRRKTDPPKIPRVLRS